MAYQYDVVVALACAAAYHSIEDSLSLRSFGCADVDAIVLYLHVSLCRMLVQSVSAGDDTLRHWIWQLTFVLLKAGREIVVDRAGVVFLGSCFSFFSLANLFCYYLVNLFFEFFGLVLFLLDVFLYLAFFLLQRSN